MASYPEIETHSTLSFAEQAAATEFGRHYVRPLDRDFIDRSPRWQKLGDVADDVVDRLHRQRDHRLAGLDDQIDVGLEKVGDPA